MRIPRKARHASAVRDLARMVLRPVTARRRVPGTPFAIRFPAWQHMGMLLPGGREFEPEIAERIGRSVGPGKTVVDIGANIGIHTLLAAHLVGPTGTVHCFEPDPQSSRWLLDNIRLNALNQVVPWSLALGDAEGVAELHLDLKSTRTSSFVPGWEHPNDRHDRQRLNVVTTRLDDLGLGAVDFLKIDVEGSELKVLAGARETIAASRPTILIEAFGADSLRDVVSFFAELDYEFADAVTGSKPDPDGHYSGNVIATPRVPAPGRPRGEASRAGVH